jgi:hypothetical protein
MKIGRPRKLFDLPCAFCGKQFRPKHTTTRFCSRSCANTSHHNARPERPHYTYNGRLSDALWRAIFAARAGRRRRRCIGREAGYEVAATVRPALPHGAAQRGVGGGGYTLVFAATAALVVGVGAGVVR